MMVKFEYHWFKPMSNCQDFGKVCHITFAISSFIGICDILALRNKYDALQEQTEPHTLNEEYENFVNTHLEAVAEFIPTKQRRKHRIPWETLAVREKCADVKTASKCNKKKPTSTNTLKLKA